MTVPKPRSPEDVASAFIASWNMRDAKDRLASLREICERTPSSSAPRESQSAALT